MEELQAHYEAIGRASGAKFWFHGLRNCFITVAERELMLPRSLTKRLVNHARPGDVTEGYAADWTVEQLREPAQQIADHIDELMVSHATPEVKDQISSHCTRSALTGTRPTGSDIWKRDHDRRHKGE